MNIYGYEILVGIGTGCFIQAGYAVIQAVIPPAEMAYGISFMMLGQSTPSRKTNKSSCADQETGQLGGIAFGLAIAGAVFINDAVSGLTVLIPDVSRSELQRAISGTSSTYFQSLPEELRASCIGVIVGALQKVFIPVYVGAAVSLVISVSFTVSAPPRSNAAASLTLEYSNGSCSKMRWLSQRRDPTVG